MPQQILSTCLWFNGQALEAAEFYTSIFPDSQIGTKQYYPHVHKDTHGQEPGSLMSVEFSLDGHFFLGLNTGPTFKFSPATSHMVWCNDQAEIDYYWEELGDGGDPPAQQCGWLSDKFGVSWQIVPRKIRKMQKGNGPKQTEGLFGAMMGMKKLDIKALEAGFDGKSH